MFDINNTDDLITFRDEVANDPISMGYAALPSTDTKKLLKTINNVEDNVEVPIPTAGPIFSHEVLMQTWAPKGALNESTPWIEALTREQGDISQYEAKYRANCGSDSLAALDDIIVQLARPEVLFGQGTVLTENDWFTSRDYTGDQ